MTKTYTFAEAIESSTKYFNGNKLAASSFVTKYAIKKPNGDFIEATPLDMHKRIAKELARVEKKKYGAKKALTYQAILDMIEDFKYIVPQGSPMAGIGNPNFVTLSNCYVIEPPVDSYGGILYTDEQIVQISKRRGGVGTDLSYLRPNGANTQNSSRTSTGPVCFANRFSNSTREVGQDGRRGALMLSLSVHHPDVVEFSHCKRDRTKVTGANISVRLTNEFLEAVRNDTTYEQRWPCTKLDFEFQKNNGGKSISREVSAREVWSEIIENAHEDAEPGLLFWDKILSESPADCYPRFRTVGTNPCSELPLSILDSCRLLLLNLFSFVDKPFEKGAKFNFAKFFKYAKIAQRLLDDIVDLELESIKRIINKIKGDPEPEHIKDREIKMWKDIYKNCKDGRRTGTGITGLADTMAAVGIRYGSDKSISFTAKIYQTLKFGCYTSSVDMAEELGPFSEFDASLEGDNPFFQRFYNESCDIGTEVLSGMELMKRMFRIGRRNIACMTSAPAGTVSILTQTTSGIEPLYYITVIRRFKGNPGDPGFRSDFVTEDGSHFMEFEVLHPKAEMWMQVTGKTDIEKSPWFGCLAEDLDFIQRVRLQAAAQKHVDHAISSTVTLPQDSTPEDTAKVYETAWEAGCKGITVYRTGSRQGIITKKEVDTKEKDGKIVVERPRHIDCNVHHTSVKGQSYFVLVGMLEGKPYEVFAGKNGFMPKSVKKGVITRKRKNMYIAKFDNCDIELSPITEHTTEMEEAVTRLTSLSLRSGSNMHRVVQQLEKVGEKQELHCFARGVSRMLKKYIENGTDEGEKCPTCETALVRQEGCASCLSCGWSKCL